MHGAANGLEAVGTVVAVLTFFSVFFRRFDIWGVGLVMSGILAGIAGALDTTSYHRYVQFGGIAIALIGFVMWVVGTAARK